MINKNLKKIIDNKYVPFLILTVILILISIRMNCNYGDDITNKIRFQSNSLSEIFSAEYNTWGSPGVPLFFMYYLVQLPQEVFKICNIMVVLLASYSISVLLNHDKNRLINWIIVLFVVIYPFSQMGTAGWIVTSVVYMFPLGFGLYSLTPIKRILMGEKINCVTAIIALLIAVGSLQMTCILVSIYALFCFYSIISKKRYKFFLLQTIISILSLIYHITTPGNKNRYIAEIQRWFPDFNMISFVNKTKLGFTDTIEHFVSNPNIFFVVFCSLLFLGVCYKYKDVLYRMIAAMPLLNVLMFGVFNNIVFAIFPKLVGALSTKSSAIITVYNFANKSSYIPIFVWILLCGCIMLSIYMIFKNSIMSLLVNVIFVVGLASRMIMSFSPTLYASSTRTFIFMYFSMIICGVFIFKEICKDVSLEKQQHILGLIAVVAIINFAEYII